jgi:excinuclease ABC subunit B
MPPFTVVSPYAPAGDQPRAIAEVATGLERGLDRQVLLGVTGSGKTFTMAKIIERVQRPALVMAHNKTLAAQLCNELKEFLPNNAVEFFISYYDYYQPEAYVPASDTYIEKTASINDDIDRLRHSATRSLFERRDTVVVASISCIYGLGLPDDYLAMSLRIKLGDTFDLKGLTRHLVKVQYERNDIELTRGRFRVRGDVLEIQPAYEDIVIRLEFFGDEVERIREINPVTGEVLAEKESIGIFPAKHFLTSPDRLEVACAGIERELDMQLRRFEGENKLLEAQRLAQRTRYDLEMLREMGYCNGVENYSRHLAGRQPGDAPATLLDYFPRDMLVFMDESHVTIPQLRGMYNGDQSRKQVLVDYGFRLPSAKDNRPLKAEEFWARVDQAVFVSATPGDWELEQSKQTVELIIRPTGLIDPEILVRPTTGQVDDLLAEVRTRVARQERVLVTTLTKRMAEDLTEYLLQFGVRVRYLHSDIKSLERIEIIRDLRRGVFDVLIGVNLLREGLDLPEVSLVCIFDADKEGFLRAERSLIQTIGRAARHVAGAVIMYADKMTDSMQRAIDETDRRRTIQTAYNTAHGITPKAVQSAMRNGILDRLQAAEDRVTTDVAVENRKAVSAKELPRLIARMEKEMHAAAKVLDFERAAWLRDRLRELREEHGA